MISTVPASAKPIAFNQSAVTYSPLFLRALDGSGAWREEARAVISLAIQLGVTLDESLLTVCDIRDLRALRDDLLSRCTK